MATPVDLGGIARQQRLDLGLSQAEVALRAGVTRQWLIRFEQGGSDVTVAKMLTVLNTLGLVASVAPRTTHVTAASATPADAIAAPRVTSDADATSLVRWRQIASRSGSAGFAELSGEADRVATESRTNTRR